MKIDEPLTGLSYPREAVALLFPARRLTYKEDAGALPPNSCDTPSAFSM